jgi:predicted nucleotidyltransferase
MEISQEQKKQLQNIGEKYVLKLILLHGSYATGQQRPGSDLDIAYLPAKSLDYKKQLELYSDLASVFGDNEERELDLKSLLKTGHLFQFEVVRDSQLLYGNELEYAKYKTYAYAQYFDNHALRELQYRLTRRLLKHLQTSHD